MSPASEPGESEESSVKNLIPYWVAASSAYTLANISICILLFIEERRSRRGVDRRGQGKI